MRRWRVEGCKPDWGEGLFVKAADHQELKFVRKGYTPLVEGLEPLTLHLDTVHFEIQVYASISILNHPPIHPPIQSSSSEYCRAVACEGGLLTSPSSDLHPS